MPGVARPKGQCARCPLRCGRQRGPHIPCFPRLAEARILEFKVQVRPALPDNRPALHLDRKRRALFVNGFYRHGFLLAPIVEAALALLSLQEPSASTRPWPCLLEDGLAATFAAAQDGVQAHWDR